MEFFLVEIRVRVELQRIHCQVIPLPINVSRRSSVTDSLFLSIGSLFISSFVEDNCSDAIMHNCTVVEGTISLIVEGGADLGDNIIIDEANTAVLHALIELDDQGLLGVKYVGNDTMPYTTLTSPREDAVTADDDRSFFWIVFAGCSLLVCVVLFALFWSKRNRQVFLFGPTASRSGYYSLR
jgi:uncharacterized glyoxalase superfamily protein PhnB